MADQDVRSNDHAFGPAALTAIDTPLLITDASLRILWLNQAMHQLKQGGFEIGRTLYELFPEQQEVLARVTPSQAAQTLDLALLYVTFQARVSLFSAADERMLWNFIPKTPPSEINSNEAFLQQCETFVTINRACQLKLAELYNHLTALKADARSETRPSPSDATPLKPLQEIARICYELDRLFLNEQQLYSTQLEFPPHEMKLVSLASYVQSLLEEIKRGSCYPDSKLTLTIEDPQIFVRIHPPSFEVALFNLIARAYDCSLPDGTIKVLLRKKEQTAILMIQDDGVGPPYADDHDLPNGIFHMPFPLNLERLIKRSLVPVSRRIIQGHPGGSLTLIGQKNQGSMVSIQLDLAQPQLQEPLLRAPEKAFDHKLSPFRILLATSCGFELL